MFGGQVLDTAQAKAVAAAGKNVQFGRDMVCFERLPEEQAVVGFDGVIIAGVHQKAGGVSGRTWVCSE